MRFPFSFTVSAGVFFAGSAVAGAVCFILCALKKKSAGDSQISAFLFSLAFCIACALFSFVFFGSEQDSGLSENRLSVFRFAECFKNEWLYFGILFGFGILFFWKPKLFLCAGVPLYLVCTVALFVFLNAAFPRASFFELKANAPSDIENVSVCCYELNPLILLPVPRFWYELNAGENAPRDSNRVSAPAAAKKILFQNEKNLNVKIPESFFYPSVFKVNVHATCGNVCVNSERLK